MEVLCTYVRMNAPLDPQKSTQKSQNATTEQHPGVDIQAILTALGRRDRKHEKETQRLNLANSDIRGADLSGASLRLADLRYAPLSEADLSDADPKIALKTLCHPPEPAAQPDYLRLGDISTTIGKLAQFRNIDGGRCFYWQG